VAEWAGFENQCVLWAPWVRLPPSPPSPFPFFGGVASGGAGRSVEDLASAVNNSGEVSEWLKEHAWKACVSVPGTEGSNPSLSANLQELERTLPVESSESSAPGEPAGGSGPPQWARFEPGQAGNGAALRTGVHVWQARAHWRARRFSR
jgi:hypothetical protein